MKYIVVKKEEKVFSFLLNEAGHAVEIHADPLTQGPGIGDIYIGLVQKVAKNLNAAFVEIVPGINGYLPFDEIVCPIYTSKGPGPDIQAGDQLVVQITRDAFGSKDMSLSTKITLQGKHVVLIQGGIGLGVSKKIPQQLRQTLKDRILSSEEFGRLQERIGQCGLVVRTSAGMLLAEMESAVSRKQESSLTIPSAYTDGAEKFEEDKDPEETDRNLVGKDKDLEETEILREEILDDIAALEAEMTDLKLKAPYRSVHSVLKKQPPRWISRVLRLFSQEIEAVITDDNALFHQMRSAAAENRNTDLNIRLYSDRMVSMEKVYSLERELEHALEKRVNLKDGGDLVIESTEALHIIDVNSGRFQGGKQKEEALLTVNLEAAREAARQIRLRNLSGIIVIDFINLKKQKNSLRILDELKDAVRKDPVKTQVVDLTKLGLVEMTRQKIEVPLKEAVKTERSQ